MNQIVDMINNDLPRAARVASIRAMLGIEDYCSRHAGLVDNLSIVFREALMNGTVYNESITVLTNDSLKAYMQKMKIFARSMGMDLSINITNISLSQSSPWTINVAYFVHINLTNHIDTWINYSSFINDSIPIQGLRDPLYSVYTYGKIHNEIIMTNHTPFVNGLNASNFELFAKNMEYYSNPSAPSFLERFEGILDPSPFGIESMINLEELAAQDIAIDTSRSIVDYLYFSNVTADYCNFTNLSSWIKLDKDHAQYYGLTVLNYTNCSK